MNKPRVSVVFCVHNAEPFIQRSVESILGQSFTDFELILIDDASTDRTPSQLVTYAAQDDRIRLHRNETNLGLTKSLNIGLHMAQGEFIARQDADDYSAPTRFEQQIAFLEAHPDVSMVATPRFVVSETNSTPTVELELPEETQQIREQLLHGKNAIAHGSVMLRKSAVDAVGEYRTFFRSSQDYDYWLRLTEAHRVGVIVEPLYHYMVHKQAITANRPFKYSPMIRYFAEQRAADGVDDFGLAFGGCWLEANQPTTANGLAKGRTRYAYDTYIQAILALRSGQYPRGLRYLIASLVAYRHPFNQETATDLLKKVSKRLLRR